MTRLAFDLAIAGSGFAGSLLAMIARRLGRSVVMIERGKHPRFAIGESSTPLANLLLEQIAQAYDLPRLFPLTQWGSWQASYPRLACGLKRGFTFYHHTLGAPPRRNIERSHQLLVAASPNDWIADTHWFRADFDQFLVQEAQALGAAYYDETELKELSFEGGGVRLDGVRKGESVAFGAQFLFDATGPRGFLHRHLGLEEMPMKFLPPTEGLYSHFRNVRRADSMEVSLDGEPPPYPVDDAALHHVFDGGWIWVLRFNNGITSAGVAARAEVARRFDFGEGEAAWRRLLNELPEVSAQFADAEPVLPFVHARRLAFRSGRIVGPQWALLPSAAGFIDPLLSTGFPLTLLGVIRLGKLIESAFAGPGRESALARYASQTADEFNAAEELVGALYRSMKDFPTFASLSQLYFAAASFSETAQRLNRPDLASGFLLSNRPEFRDGMRACCRAARDLENRPAGEAPSRTAFDRLIARAIEPFNIAGLNDPKRRNWYPVRVEDLFESTHKLGASEAEIRALLERCGFTADQSATVR